MYHSSGLYYKNITTVNDDSSIINKFEASLTDDARVIIYNHHMFIVQAIGANVMKVFTMVIYCHYMVKLSFCVIKLYALVIIVEWQ